MKKKKVVANDIQKDCQDIISLAPKYDEDIKQYEDIITSALSELEHPKTKKKKNKNIAITGMYGAGKSTVIKSFFSKHKEYNVCYVTLGYYSHKDPDIKEQTEEYNIISTADKVSIQNEEKVTKKKIYSDDEIEKSILQQILFSTRPEIIPNSRFSRIDKFTNLGREFLFSLIISIFITLIIENIYFFVSKPTNIDWGYLFVYLGHFFTMVIINVILIIMIMRGMIKLNKFTFHHLEITKTTNDESLLNNYIDELIHHFLYNKESIVVFEDLDRFPNALIVFSKLKEINSILNSSIKNKTIQFIYAIGDNLFKNSEEKTKFFDVIIPIVPVLCSINAVDYFLELKKNNYIIKEIKSDHLKKIGRYIQDFRQAKQIVNEYKVYLNEYNKSLKNCPIDNDILLNDKNQLFYLISYKIIFPQGFLKLLDNNSNINQCLQKKLFINDIDYINSQIDLQQEIVVEEIKGLKEETTSWQGVLVIDNKKIDLNINLQDKNQLFSICKKILRAKLAVIDTGTTTIECLNDRSAYTKYIELYETLLKIKMGYPPTIIKMKIEDFESENNIQLTPFEKMMLEDNIIDKNYKRLISKNFNNFINTAEQRYLENINSKIRYSPEFKIENIEELYSQLTNTDFYYDNICIDAIFDYISKIDDIKKITFFLEEMSEYRFSYILNYTLSNRKNNIMKKHPELVDKLWEYVDLNPTSDESIIKLIIFTLKYCKKEEIDDKSYFYICINTYEHLDDIFEKNIDDIKEGLLNTLVKFNSECEYNHQNIKFLDFIYENKRFYGNVELIIAIIKSRGIAVNNKNFMTIIYNNKEELCNLYEYTGPLFKNFFEECIDQIISLENSGEVIQDILSNQIASIEQKKQYLKYEKGKIYNLTTINYIFLPDIVKNNIYEINWDNLLYILNGNYDKYNELNILQKTFNVLQDNIMKLINNPLSNSKKIILTDIVLNKVKTDTPEAKEIYLSNKDLVAFLINNSYLITDNVSTAAQIYKFQFELKRKQINKFLQNSFKYFRDNISNNIDERLLEDILSINLSRQKKLDFYLNYQHIYNNNINKKLFKILTNGENLKISNQNLINITSRFEYNKQIEILEKYYDTNKINEVLNKKND